MPTLPPSSTDSSTPSDAPDSSRPPRWRLPALLFAATLASVLYAGAGNVDNDTAASPVAQLLRGWVFALPLLSILLAHEFGHYFAARAHRVPASLPLFLPMPISPFGTWGAIISMPRAIASRRALLDVGAAGPLAGMAVALPVLCYGLSLSKIEPLPPHGLLEGECLLYMLLKYLIVGPVPAGYDVFLHPVAFAGWGGLFVTMINLLPFGQLDGGHIAYALFGRRHDRFGPWVRWALLPLCLANLARNLLSARAAGFPEGSVAQALSNSFFWFAWFVILTVLGRVGGTRHPPTASNEPLGPGRRAIAIGSLLLFVLLFMPAPFTVH